MSLFFGDGAAAPAVSVLSQRAEGLGVALPACCIAIFCRCAVTTGLFWLRRFMVSGRVGQLFGAGLCSCGWTTIAAGSPSNCAAADVLKALIAGGGPAILPGARPLLKSLLALGANRC